MGEAKRRRTEIIEHRTFSIKQIAKMGRLCEWAGCTATVKGPPPRGWAWFQSYWGAEATKTFSKHHRALKFRDGVLCPRHAHEFEGLLKPLGRPVEGPAQGSA
jgi:hypothetical protein